MAASDAKRLKAVPASDADAAAAGGGAAEPGGAEGQASGPDAAAAAAGSSPPARAGLFAGLQVPGPIVRVAVGVLAVGVMTTGLFFLVTDVLLPGLGPAQAAAPQESEAQADALPGEQYKIDEIIVNPAGTAGRRFLRLGIALETSEGPAGEAVMAELEARQSQVRDLFIREFSARTLEELTAPMVREELRVACQQKVNDVLVKGEVANLYFTDYVLQ